MVKVMRAPNDKKASSRMYGQYNLDTGESMIKYLNGMGRDSIH